MTFWSELKNMFSVSFWFQKESVTTGMMFIFSRGLGKMEVARHAASVFLKMFARRCHRSAALSGHT